MRIMDAMVALWQPLANYGDPTEWRRVKADIPFVLVGSQIRATYMKMSAGFMGPVKIAAMSVSWNALDNDDVIGL
jgi:hypothetical protein